MSLPNRLLGYRTGEGFRVHHQPHWDKRLVALKNLALANTSPKSNHITAPRKTQVREVSYVCCWRCSQTVQARGRTYFEVDDLGQFQKHAHQPGGLVEPIKEEDFKYGMG